MKMKIINITSLLFFSINGLYAYTTYSIKSDKKIIQDNKITQYLSLKQTLDIWKKYHQEFYGEKYVFIVKDTLNISDFATKEEVEFIKHQNLETLKRFIERKLGYHIKFKTKILNDITIIILKPIDKLKGYNKADEMIKTLRNIQHTALTLPNFNARKFNKDIEKVILKLQEYKNLEGK